MCFIVVYFSAVMAEENDSQLDFAIALSLSHPSTPPIRIKSEADREDDWLDELLARESLQEESDQFAVDTSYDDLDDKQLYQQTHVPYSVSKPSIYQVTHDYYELHDPTPSIHQLLTHFDQLFFNSLLGSVSVEWSPKMTTCAGITYYRPMSHFCYIRLSRPILTLRPRKDLVETLLHEMIHALLFIAEDNRDHSDHGRQFQYHQKRINDSSGSNISIYHSFHDEVKSLKKHWWRCEGPCRYRQPYYGYVKRAVNRAPGKADTWWRSHHDTCGGKFVKIRSPDKKVPGKSTLPKKNDNNSKNIPEPAKISDSSFNPNSQVNDFQNRIGTIEHSFGTNTLSGYSQTGTVSTQSDVKSRMEIDLMTSPILIQSSDDEFLSEPMNSDPPLLTPTKSPSRHSPMLTSPVHAPNATRYTSKNSSRKNSSRVSPYMVSQPIGQSTPSKVLNLQECLFCNGFFQKESFDEHFSDCVKCFPSD